MGFSGAGIGSDLLKVIERNGLWRKHGIDVRTIYLSSGSLMAQTLSSGDIGIAGFDTPAMLSLALAGHSLKVIAVPINRLEPFFVVRSSVETPGRSQGQKDHDQPLRLGLGYYDSRGTSLLEARPG